MLGKLKEAILEFGRILKSGRRVDRAVAWLIVLLAVGLLAFNLYNALSPDTEKHVDTSAFMEQLEAGNVEELHIANADGTVSGKYKEPDGDGVTAFRSNIPERSDVYNAKYLEAEGVEYDYSKPSNLWSTLLGLLWQILYIAMLIGAMYWLLNSQMGGGMSLPFQDDDESFSTEIPDTTFDDVAGIPEALEEVSEIVTFLKDPDVYARAGAKCPKGVLLAGASGVGKTLIARALAGEAGVRFISASGSDFVKIFVGAGASRVRKLFAKARKVQPCIVFIDEIDAVGGDRDGGMGTHDEHIQTINALLSEMDGFSKDDHIIVIAATNRADALDPALVRPGRFDRIISIDTPAKEGRKEILLHYAQDHPFADKVDFDQLAAHTYGFSGAQLENVINQAATLAARRSIADGSTPKITAEDLDEGIARTISGPAMRSKKMNDEEKRQVAYHEAGHAVVQYLLPGCDEVQKISIVSRHIPTVGTAMGYVQSYSEEDSYVTTSKQLSSELAALLAGRCSEKMYCGIESAGAYNDLQKASALAYDMVDKFAFDTPLGDTTWRVAVTDKLGNAKASEKRLAFIDDNVESILKTAYETSKRIVAANRRKIETIVDELLEKETIDAERIREIMEAQTEDEVA